MKDEGRDGSGVLGSGGAWTEELPSTLSCLNFAKFENSDKMNLCKNLSD